ncbi:hypothetical protein AVEN_55298-1 [Araneus ventricosus]|uniref:Uncharacterized protein n=1 Tax=Araneus ventricosus TaxID=182803 RepID=A0A4Y2D6R0_ARAVE|nr:hypothetical protein AVEN_55298-1 [Araneus ventricosus]
MEKGSKFRLRNRVSLKRVVDSIGRDLDIFIAKIARKYHWLIDGFGEWKHHILMETKHSININKRKTINRDWKTVDGNGRITDAATLSDILEVDAELLTVSYPTYEEILKSLKDNKKVQENDSYSENEDVIQLKPHRTEMLQSFETNKRGFEMEENVPVSIFSPLIKC